MKLKFVKILLILLPFIAAVILLQALLVRFHSRYAGKIPKFFHGLVNRILGFSVQAEGDVPAPDRPALIIANHVSWADIPVLGAVTEGRFVAKADISGWPLIGWLAKLQRTVFVERTQRNKAKDQANELHNVLANGQSVILFPEGTSNDSNVILPFKSSLFGLAESGEDFDIAPALLLYDKVHGMPSDRRERPLVAWYGETDFIPHAKRLLDPVRVNARVIFAPKVKFSDFPSRKEAAIYCETRIKTLYREVKCNRSAPRS
jgi:lyso-ornithine lipid O-acyltransferase